MTSATTEPSRRTGERHAEGYGHGLVVFASVLLVVVGCFSLIGGMATVANSHMFATNAHYVLGVIGLAGLASLGLLPGRTFENAFQMFVVGVT